jgi:cytochrome c-type biogenesis protein CcmH/NrfG
MRQAVEAQPDVQMRLQLAQLLMSTGDRAGAVVEYRKVLEAKPNNVDALNNLAGILATSADEKIRDGAEAVRLAERAVRLTGSKQATMIGTLAAAYAEAGRYPEAVTTAEKAVQLANASGNPRLAAMHQQLIALYTTGRPYHEPRAPSP